MLNFLKNRKNAVADLKKQRNELNTEIDRLEQNKISLLEANKNQEDELRQLKAQTNNLDKEINSRLQAVKNIETGFGILEEIGFERYVPTMYNDDIENEIFECESKLAEMLGDDKVIIQTREYMIDGSASKGKKFQVAYGRNLLTAANTYIQSKEKSVTVDNYHKMVELISKKYAKFSADGNLLGISLSNDYFKIRLELLKLKLELKEQKARDRELLREEKRRMKEQKKLLAEAEAEKKRLENERKNLQKLFAKAVSEAEQHEIQEKLAKVDKRIKDIDWRVEHESAGWLYIATTPCLEGMYKAGCSRQLSPLSRLAQLSSASVPYSFECRGLVFSEQVFDLETKLHNRLDAVRVNKENKRKEFFYGDPSEAIKILTDEFGVTVHFIDEDWLNETEMLDE